MTPVGGPAPVLGRAAERDILRDALATRRPTLLVGEAGIGKTTLAHAALDDLRRPYRVGGGLSTLSWMPRLAIARALGRTEIGGDVDHVAQRVVSEAAALFFDDAQWADPDSIRVLELVAGRIPLLAALRRDSPGAADVKAELVAAGFDVLEVGPLAEPEASELARSVRSELSDTDVQRVVRAAAGSDS